MATELGRVGVWWAALGGASAAVEREVAAELDADGWPTLWFGEAPDNKDALVHAGLLLAATSQMNVATGIANIYARDAMAARLGADALAEAYADRFVLGLGVSHQPIVDIRGAEYSGRPVATMKAFLEAFGETTYAPPPPREPVTVLLAALRPRMLELSRELAAGAHPYFVPVEHTRRAREILGEDKLLAPELGFVLGGDDAALAAGHRFASRYLQLPNYVNNLQWLGYSDEDVAGAGSERLVRDLIATGSVEDVVLRVAAHLDAGADHVCLQPIAPDLATGRAWLRELRPAVAAL